MIPMPLMQASIFVRSLRRLLLAAILACIACFEISGQRQAFGHGEPIQIGYTAGTNTLTVAPTVYENFNPDENIAPSALGLSTTYPGFTRTDNLPANADVSLQFLSSLLYWNVATGASDPLPTPTATVNVIKNGTLKAILDANGATGTNPLPMTTFVGFPGEHFHFLGYQLVNPDATGLYAMWAEALAAGPNFTGGVANASDPFLIVLNYGITDEVDYATGVERLAAVPVPEPSSLALVAFGSLLVTWQIRRRAR